MYKHILIPTDGSQVAEKGVDAAIDFAREAHARVTCFTAMPEYRIPTQGEILSGRMESYDAYERRAQEQAQAILERVAARARAAGVDVDTDMVLSDTPYEAIIRAAVRHECDLIFMASHGRRGVAELVHGSQTRGVLSHSKIPTMVYR
jgi:nucleotide-binding universal stress UspA family protein